MPTIKQKTNIIDLLIPLFALGLITFGIGNYGLYEPHESHFAMVGNEMVWREDWITPYLNGAPYLNKPPLLYWLIAIATTVFGNTEFAVRLPIALAGWLGIIIAGKWSQDLWGVTANRITVLMLSVTLGWFVFTHQILIDVLLGTLVLSSNYFLWKLLQKPQSWLNFFCLYFSIALSILAKGLIGLFLVFGSYLAIIIYRRDLKIFQKTKLFLGIIFIIVIILPWCIAIEKANPGFWHYFIVNEHLARILDRRFPPDYVVSQINPLGYLGIAALWCFPWIIFLPSVLKFNWQKLQNKPETLQTLEIEAIIILAISWLLPIIIFLPLSSRLIYYSVPAIPSYVILCAGFFNHHLLKTSLKKKALLKFNLEFFLYGCLFIIMGTLATTAIAIFPKLFNSFDLIQKYPIITSLIITTILTLALGFLFTGTELFQQKYSLALRILIISLFLLYTIIAVGFSFYQDVRSSKNLVAIIESKLPVNSLWIFEGSREIGAAAGLSYYLNQGKDIQQTEASFKANAEIPLGLVRGNETKIYRYVLVLEDSGDNRLPPKFPGEKPQYLINKQQLQTYWNSNRPVVFVTDFLRNFQDETDPVRRNLPQNAGKPVFQIANKQVYLNQSAVRKLYTTNQE